MEGTKNLWFLTAKASDASPPRRFLGSLTNNLNMKSFTSPVRKSGIIGSASWRQGWSQVLSGLARSSSTVRKLICCLASRSFAAGHGDVLGEVLLQAVIVSPGARSLHKMKCRAIALQIKTSEEVDGNHVSSKWIQIWKIYNITIVLGDLGDFSFALLDQLDMGSWVLRWWRETDFKLSALGRSK